MAFHLIKLLPWIIQTVKNGNLQADIRNISNVSVNSVIDDQYMDLYISLLSFVAALIFFVILMVIFLFATRDIVRTKMNTILAGLASMVLYRFIAVSTMLHILAATLKRSLCILSRSRYHSLFTKVNTAIPLREDEIAGKSSAKLFRADETAESPSAKNLHEDEIQASVLTIPPPQRQVNNRGFTSAVNGAIPVHEPEIAGEFLAKLIYVDETAESPSAENLHQDEILASVLTTPPPQRPVRNRGFKSAVISAVPVHKDEILASVLTTPQPQRPIKNRGFAITVNSAIPVHKDEILASVLTIPPPQRPVQNRGFKSAVISAVPLHKDEILASVLTTQQPQRPVQNRGLRITVNSAVPVHKDEILASALTTPQPQRPVQNRGLTITVNSAVPLHKDEILASVLTTPFNYNDIDWKPTSVIHKQKLERLLQVWRKEPESITMINNNGVCFKDEFRIGRGSCGTEVYIGLGSDGIERAVKRSPKRLCKNLLKNERDILTSPNAVNSPRIVNYWFYDGTTSQDFCYLVLNLNECNLDEYIREKGEAITPLRAREMIRQVLEGLEALHAREPRIMHRNLKPTNILVDVNGDLVLSGFGIGSFLPEEGETYRTTTGGGSEGWLAKECVDWDSMHSSIRNSSDRKKLSWKEKSDIQAAGMLAFYIRTNGGHPFGPEIVQMINLHQNNPVDLKKPDDEVFKDLLSQMLDQELDKRQNFEQALKHPYFMSAKEQMKFLEAVGNQREVKMVDINCDVVKLLDNLDPSQPRSPLLPSDWKVVVHPDDLNTFCKGGRPPSKENGGCYTHFLRFIRNVFQHWNDKPRPALKDMRTATCLEEYFLQYFPTLPLVVHQIVRDRPDWKTRDTLKEFFPDHRAEAC